MAEAAGKRGAESKDQADVEPGIPYSQRLQHTRAGSRVTRGASQGEDKPMARGTSQSILKRAFEILADPEDVAD
jgi:hypothetical protein